MFYEITSHLYPQTERIPYSIEKGIRSALRHSQGHPVVQEAVEYLRSHFTTTGFSGDHLLELWRTEEVAFTTKCLATFWWGNLARGVATAYSPENINRLQAFSGSLLLELETAQNASSFDVAISMITNIFRSFEAGGAYKLEQVNVSFFTKIFEFYFASHPIASNPGFLPIICDDWLRQGVFVEMGDSGANDLRDVIYKSPASLRQHNYSYAESYIAFISYFNQRVTELQIEFPELTPFILEGYVFSPAGRDAIRQNV